MKNTLNVKKYYVKFPECDTFLKNIKTKIQTFGKTPTFLSYFIITLILLQNIVVHSCNVFALPFSEH